MLNPELSSALPHKWQVPLPIPLPVETGEPGHYMPLHQARAEAFTDCHQPSIISRQTRRGKHNTLRIPGNPTELVMGRPRKQPHPRAQEMITMNQNNDLVKRHLVRGVVHCKDCCKPRVIYSATAPSRMVPHAVVDGQVPSPEDVHACQVMAKQVLMDACSSPLYVCGSTALDHDHAFSSVFVTQEELTCADHIEAFFYTATPSSRQQLSVKLCCFCALEDGEVDDELSKLYRTVLPVCQQCLGEGALIPVRYAQRIAASRAARATIQAEREARVATKNAISETNGRGRDRGRDRGGGGAKLLILSNLPRYMITTEAFNMMMIGNQCVWECNYGQLKIKFPLLPIL